MPGKGGAGSRRRGPESGRAKGAGGGGRGRATGGQGRARDLAAGPGGFCYSSNRNERAPRRLAGHGYGQEYSRGRIDCDPAIGASMKSLDSAPGTAGTCIDSARSNRRIPASSSGELPLLMARIRALKAQLDRLNRQLSHIHQGAGSPLSVAVVDAMKCVGCGICETACPVGAIAVHQSAMINAAFCMGCGECAKICPQGAIALRPVLSAESI